MDSHIHCKPPDLSHALDRSAAFIGLFLTFVQGLLARAGQDMTWHGMTGAALKSSGVCRLSVTGKAHGSQAQDISSANVCELLFLTAKVNACLLMHNNTDLIISIRKYFNFSLQLRAFV